MKRRTACATVFLRSLLQPEPLSPNRALRIQTHHRRPMHVWHCVFLGRVSGRRRKGGMLAADLRQNFSERKTAGILRSGSSSVKSKCTNSGIDHQKCFPLRRIAQILTVENAASLWNMPRAEPT
jgi:hypothetical protein